MKILATILLALSLTACGSLPQKYDNNEFQMLTEFYVDVKEIKNFCSVTPELVPYLLDDLQRDINVLYYYSKYTPNNEEVTNVVNILKGDIEEFKESQYENNKAYCEMKSHLIIKKTEIALKTIPKKPR